jgi:ubiquinone/menaquinone biosynthesis C-methylase UbiE
MEKQVSIKHYDFARYMTRIRWQSLWCQVMEVNKLSPRNVLEIGPGKGYLTAILRSQLINVETLDIDKELNPTHTSSATKISLNDNSYDVVCAFQILEHLKYDDSLIAIEEMLRVSKRHVVISLPDAAPFIDININTSFLREMKIQIEIYNPFKKIHIFDGEHYWEINKKNYPLKKIINDIQMRAKLIRTYRSNGNSYHRFIIIEKNNYI